MLTYEQARRILRKFPWPTGVKRPMLNVGVGEHGGYACQLYRNDLRGLTVAIVGPTPEGALRHAITAWVQASGENEEVIEATRATALRLLAN